MKEYYIFFESKEAAEAAYKTIVGFLRRKLKEMKTEKNFELDGRSILIKPKPGVYEKYHFVLTNDRFKKFISREAIITFEEAFHKILITEDLNK